MPRLPAKLKQVRREANGRCCPAHRAWVRRHRCCVPACERLPIECAHVRHGTDGGASLKPSDRWAISLCQHHHSEQHRLGELSFADKYGLDLIGLALEFATRSPHAPKLFPASALARQGSQP